MIPRPIPIKPGLAGGTESAILSVPLKVALKAHLKMLYTYISMLPFAFHLLPFTFRLLPLTFPLTLFNRYQKQNKQNKR